MIRDELEMLAMRCEELADYDVRHVVVEATRDHQNHPKPLHFTENQGRFKPWAHRIIHIVADELPENPAPGPHCPTGAPHATPQWAREHAQRDYALPVLEDADPKDRVLISDVDELPSREALEAKPRPAVALQQNVCAFAVDWLAFKELTSVIATVAYVRANGSLARVRDRRGEFPVIGHGGWHFTWVGGRDWCEQKLDAFCHVEARDTVRRGLESGDFIERGAWNVAQLTPVDVDSRWPAMIRERRCPPEWYRPR